MVSLNYLLLVPVLCIIGYNAEDLQVGTSVNVQLAFSENVKLSSVPFKTRTKNIFYNTNENNKPIKGVTAIDLDKSEAKASITAGGVGSTFVNVKIKSSKGESLNYFVQIFV